MVKFDVKNEEKAPLGANKNGRGFVIRNNVWSEVFAGTSKSINDLQVKFYCGEGNEGGRFSECLRVTSAYLIRKLDGGGDVKTLNRNGKVFETSWTEPVGPTPEATKAMLQAEYGMRAKKVEKLQINLITEYGLVLIQCTNYL